MQEARQLEYLEPNFSEWGTVLNSALARRNIIAARLGETRIRAIREGIWTEAQRYTEALLAKAREVGVPVAPSFAPQAVLGASPLIMAGHQPVMYHPGLIFKVEALNRAVKISGACGINVVIDTDDGDSGSLVWPLILGERLEIKQSSIATSSSGLYALQRVANREHVIGVFGQMLLDLRSSGLFAAAEQAEKAGRIYAALSGESMAIAHTIVRCSFYPPNYLEVPLSLIVRNTELKAVLSDFAGDSKHFATTYNETLEAYRKEHKIRNPANPFPNMKAPRGGLEGGESPDSRSQNAESSEQGWEMPLWRISSTDRRPYFGESKFIERDYFLAPRGSITTLLLRGYASDLFIHGRGGGKYDLFVNEFAARYLGVELPSFVVASDTKYILPRRIEQLEREITLATSVKEMISRTEHFLGLGIFSPHEEEELGALIHQRGVLRAEVQAGANAHNSHDKEDRSAIHALNAANRKLREYIEKSSLAPIIARLSQNQESLEKWSFREFPFFLYHD